MTCRVPKIVPNTPRNCGQSRLIVVSLFLCRQGNRLVRALRVSSSKLAASSILVTRSTSSFLVRALYLWLSYSNKHMTRISRLVMRTP
jgi:hypothetical protein